MSSVDFGSLFLYNKDNRVRRGAVTKGPSGPETRGVVKISISTVTEAQSNKPSHPVEAVTAKRIRTWTEVCLYVREQLGFDGETALHLIGKAMRVVFYSRSHRKSAVCFFFHWRPIEWFVPGDITVEVLFEDGQWPLYGPPEKYGEKILEEIRKSAACALQRLKGSCENLEMLFGFSPVLGDLTDITGE